MGVTASVLVAGSGGRTTASGSTRLPEDAAEGMTVMPIIAYLTRVGL